MDNYKKPLRIRILKKTKSIIDLAWTILLVIANRLIGRRLKIGPGARIALGSIVTGNVELGPHAYIGPHSEVRGYVRIGTASALGHHSSLRAGNTPETGIYIGSYLAGAPELVIQTRNHDYKRVPMQIRASEQMSLPPPYAGRGPVRIGNDVWIARRVIILSGVTIGDGAVIGAGAVVTKDIPPYKIAVGIPAKPIADRFTPEELQILQKSEYKNWYQQPPTKQLAKLLEKLNQELEKARQKRQAN